MDYATMTKDELRTACKAVGIAYGKLSNEGMRAALTAAAPTPQRKPLTEEEEPPGSYPDVVMPEGVKIEKNRQTRNGVTRPSVGGKCRAVWDALDALDDPTLARVRDLATEQGWDKTTAQVQFYRWRKFHGLSGR
jgi:hypothetical protein